ncbi:MAG: hypothetical protein IKR34_02490 [Candidatus Gastranaerophilales bacterium]|nr:hypothetical protein [Candidatus Gastranaerophilales bacterium]
MDNFNNDFAISTAIGSSKNELQKYNKGKTTNDTQYKANEDGSLFSITRKDCKIEYKDGKMSYYESYDKDGNVTGTITSVWDDDGSVEYYFDAGANDKIDSHEHYKYDKSGNITEWFYDHNNDGNFELKNYSKYKNNTLTSEQLIQDLEDDGIEDYCTTTTYYEDGYHKKEEIEQIYKNNSTSTRQYNEDGELVSYSYDNHNNDNIFGLIDNILHPEDKDYVANRVFLEDGKFYDEIDYDADGTVDKIFDPYQTQN